MQLDDRFDDLVASLGGFYRAWYVVTGLELGLFARLRGAGTAGLTPDELARRTDTEPSLITRWAWGAVAHDLLEPTGTGGSACPSDIARILLDATRPEYLGGQYLHAAIGSLDFAGLPDVLRTGVPLASRPDRYREAIERLTVQDIAVFFQEVLAAAPQLVLDLVPGSRILDIHCGGRSLADRDGPPVPGHAADRRGVRAGLRCPCARGGGGRGAERPDHHRAGRGDGDRSRGQGHPGLLPVRAAPLSDPEAAIRSALAALAPGGWLIALDWYLPTDPDELQTRHAELLAGIQLDELLMGTRLVTRSEALGWFAGAGVPTPVLIDLPSGATAIIARH